MAIRIGINGLGACADTCEFESDCRERAQHAEVRARVALTVPAVVMMAPGVYALETLVYFDRGEILQGLSAGVLVGFVVGSIAFGLAAARFISQPEWLRE